MIFLATFCTLFVRLGKIQHRHMLTLIVKKCEWCHKTFIGQMVTARFCSSKCCDQAYRYKRKVQSGKYASVGGDTEMSTLPRRVDERKLRREYLKDKQFLSPTEAAKLLGVSRSTIYNYLGLQILKAKQLAKKWWNMRLQA